MKKQLFIVFVGMMLFGCGAHTVSPSSLRQADSEKTLKLGDEWEYSYSRAGGIVKFAAVPGEYRAELQGQDGTYFRGVDHAIRFIAISGKRKVVQFFEGGIFLPSDKAVSAKVYYYRGMHTPLRVFDSETGVEQPLDYSPDGKTSRQPIQNQTTDNSINTATNLVVSPTATPSQALTGGIGAGIGVAIVDAMIRADAGTIVFPEEQPENGNLRDTLTER